MKSYTYKIEDGVIIIQDLRRGAILPSIDKQIIQHLLFDQVDLSLPVIICDQFGIWDQLIIKHKKLLARKPLGTTSLERAKLLITKTLKGEKPNAP